MGGGEACDCHIVHVVIEGQLTGISSSLCLPRGTQGMDSGYQAWQQAPFPTKPSLQSPPHILIKEHVQRD